MTVSANPPMTTELLLRAGATCWAAVGFAFAVLATASTGGDAAVVAWVASVAFPLCALLAAMALRHRRFRRAGALLVLSAATPTYFAWAINVPALLGGILLVLLGGTVGQRGRSSRPRATGPEPWR